MYVPSLGALLVILLLLLFIYVSLHLCLSFVSGREMAHQRLILEGKDRILAKHFLFCYPLFSLEVLNPRGIPSAVWEGILFQKIKIIMIMKNMKTFACNISI